MGSFEATGQPIIERIASTPDGENQPWIVDLNNNKVHKATKTEVSELNIGAGRNEDPLGTVIRGVFTQEEIDDQHIFSFAISPDHKMVAYSGMIDGPLKSAWIVYPLMVRPLAGGPAVTVATWPEYPGLFWWGSDNKEVFYTDYSNSNPDDPRKTKLRAVSVHGGSARTVFESPFSHWMYSVDRSNRFAALLREDRTTAPEIALADLSTGEVRALAALNPEMQNRQITPAQRIDVPDKQGEHFWGHYVLPLGYQPGNAIRLSLLPTLIMTSSCAGA